MKETSYDWRNVGKLLRSGKIGVIPTDTLYGIVASVHTPQTVERLYDLREREKDKPCIVLLAKKDEITAMVAPEYFKEYHDVFDSLWPGAISIVVPVEGDRWEHIHRKTQSVAFRVPKERKLRELLRESGPIIAPSANIAGATRVASTIEEARGVFGESVDVYLDGGVREGSPSTLIRLERGDILILREGRVSREDIQEKFPNRRVIVQPQK